ncbi:MAG TPA: glycoside hydrolase family 92 protein, partial [Petrimonas sp.]|nr:glycoside hydrolase family 92 protein [Petrimonas sp.]
VDPYSGYNGDEDQGMLGALGVLMAIGLFDLQGCVGDFPELEITSPLFDKIELRFPSLTDPQQNTLFRISVKKKNPADIYIQHAILNSIKWTRFQFPISVFFKRRRT